MNASPVWTIRTFDGVQFVKHNGRQVRAVALVNVHPPVVEIAAKDSTSEIERNLGRAIRNDHLLFGQGTLP